MTTLPLLLLCAAIGPITETEGIGLRLCHPDDRALIEIQPVHPSPNRVGGWFTTTNRTLFARHLTMIPNGTNILRAQTICGGATSAVTEIQFILRRVVLAPKVGLVRETETPTPPLPPGMIAPLPTGDNYARYRVRLESGMRRSQ